MKHWMIVLAVILAFAFCFAACTPTEQQQNDTSEVTTPVLNPDDASNLPSVSGASEGGAQGTTDATGTDNGGSTQSDAPEIETDENELPFIPLGPNELPIVTAEPEEDETTAPTSATEPPATTEPSTTTATTQPTQPPATDPSEPEETEPATTWTGGNELPIIPIP